jgi:hypothetical protein
MTKRPDISLKYTDGKLYKNNSVYAQMGDEYYEDDAIHDFKLTQEQADMLFKRGARVTIDDKDRDGASSAGNFRHNMDELAKREHSACYSLEVIEQYLDTYYGDYDYRVLSMEIEADDIDETIDGVIEAQRAIIKAKRSEYVSD